MEINWIALLLAALVPLIVGFVWYHPKVFGNAWMAAAGLTEESLKGANMLKIFGLTYLLSFMAAMVFQTVVIHQFHMLSVLADEPGLNDPQSEPARYLADFLAKYGNHYRTFKHGAFHGVFFSLLLILPVVGINAMFERRSFKYIAVNTGFWIVAFGLMGGIISAMK